MNSSHPLVSVLMTAYNREKYIAEAIESVLASTYTNFELIILDDCSKDETLAIAKSYESKDNRIKVYVNKHNLGQFPNRNKIVEFAKGEYILYADSDDKLLQDGLERIINGMQQFPESNFGMYCPIEQEITCINSSDAIERHFFEKPFLVIGPGGTIMRRKFFESIGKYPTNFGVPGDMYFNLKAACHSSIVLLPFEFIFYRIHDGQEFANKYDYLYNNYRYLDAALKELPLGLSPKKINWLHKKNKRRFLVNVIKFLFKTGSVRKTYSAIQYANFTLKDGLLAIFH